MTDGASDVAERCLQALEAAGLYMPEFPAKAAGCVLIALGSSPAEDEALSRHLAVLFRADLVAAMEAMVRRALSQLGEQPS